MNRRESSSINKHFIIALVLVCISITFLGTSSLSSGVRLHMQTYKYKDKLPQVNNETESFHLVSAERNEDYLLLRMKNNSGKVITAYTLSLGDGLTRMGRDYYPGGDGVSPGAIEDISIPLINISASMKSAPEHWRVTVLAVVFDDRSSEGDFEAAADILNDRLGQKIQLKRINRLIRNALKTSDSGILATLGKLKHEISSLSEDQGSGQSRAVRSGLHFAKERAIKQIEELEEQDASLYSHQAVNRSANIRRGFKEIIEKSEAWITKF